MSFHNSRPQLWKMWSSMRYRWPKATGPQLHRRGKMSQWTIRAFCFACFTKTLISQAFEQLSSYFFAKLKNKGDKNINMLNMLKVVKVAKNCSKSQKLSSNLLLNLTPTISVLPNRELHLLNKAQNSHSPKADST